jgi:hypothetical protein
VTIAYQSSADSTLKAAVNTLATMLAGLAVRYSVRLHFDRHYESSNCSPRVLADAKQIARVHVASWKVAYGKFMPPKQMAWISERREIRGAGDLISNLETPT